MNIYFALNWELRYFLGTDWREEPLVSYRTVKMPPPRKKKKNGRDIVPFKLSIAIK